MIHCGKCGGGLDNTGPHGEEAMMPLRRFHGPEGPLIVRHHKCVNGHFFHATGPEDTLVALPQYGQLPCDCEWGQRAATPPNSN
jgi:hypothetical protein